MLFNGTSAAAVDLHPTDLSGFNVSAAFGTDGTQQVGEAYGPGSEYTLQAIRGLARPRAAVNLTAAGYNYLIAYGVGGKQQVGYGAGLDTNSTDHALLWTGTVAVPQSISIRLI